jgi:hypothetical protein
VHLRGFGRLFDFMRGVHREPSPQIQFIAVERPRSLPQLPLLTHLEALDAADWLVRSLTTFGRNVSSFLPGDLPAYARVYHPFNKDDGSGKIFAWRELAPTEEQLRDPATAADFAWTNASDMRAREGTLHPSLVEVLIEHLRPATTTPELCYFAVWEGFGDSVVPRGLGPKLELPQRNYDVFSGPLAAARTSLSISGYGVGRSANLWWPADHAWCVATEIDFAWTYVGGPRDCIAAVLADPRLEAVATSALADW